MTQTGCRCGNKLKKYSRYCSHSCANRYRTRTKTSCQIECQTCGKFFYVDRNRHKKAKFCSLQCRNNAWSIKYKKCIQCLTTKYKYKKNGLCIYCFNRLSINKIVWQNKNHRRRHYYQSGDVDTTFLKWLWKNTIFCILCHAFLPDHCEYPSGRHLDHIIPLIHKNPHYPQGTHSKKNVRYICAFCNIHRPHDGSDIAFNLQLHANNHTT